MKKLLPLVVGLAAAQAVANEFEVQHAAHEHGKAMLNVALSGKQLEIELDSPAANLVGFEHKASSEEDIAKVVAMEKSLRQGYQLIGLPEAALCVLDTPEVKHTLLTADASHDDHDHHDDHEDHKDHDDHDDHKDHDDHEDHKDHDDHDDHDHHDDHKDHDDHEGHDHGDGSAHSDVQVSYSFHCVAPEKLNQINVGLFREFPTFEELKVQLIAPSGQKLLRLSADNSVIKF